jgi:hypothetical protein
LLTPLVYPDKDKVQLRQTTHKMDVFGVNLALRYQNSGAAMPDPRNSHASAATNSPHFQLSHTSQHHAAPLAQQPTSPSLFAQFQARYPSGSLTADLLDIRGDQYIVKAAIQVGGTVLATGMAAEKSLEAAEDRARLRALEVLGLQIPPSAPPAPSAYEVQVHLMTNHQNEAEFAPAPRLVGGQDYPDLRQLTGQKQKSANWSEPALEIPAVVPEPTSPITGDLFDSTYADVYPDFELESEAIAEPPSRHPEMSEPAQNGRNGKRVAPPREKTAPPEPASTPTREPMDLSEVIAQTSVEIKRLGWTDVQGRTYLQKTYGKRSRQHLTDDELLEFLEYLRSQPSPNESPF